MSNNIHGLNADDDKPPRHDDSSNESGSDDEGRQGFFVGGSERSGQEVLGPNRRGDLQSLLFDAIQRAGAERLTPEQVAALEKERQQKQGASQGSRTGFRLGGHGIATEQIGTSSQPSNASSTLSRLQVVRMNIWQNGFSLDDGPLRSFEDPQNRAFLQAVLSKRIPPELNSLYPGREVDLRIERKNEEYVPPKVKPFAGAGYRLGSVTPDVVGSQSRNIEIVDLEPPPPLLNSEEANKLVEKAQEEVNLNETLPITRIQIRFPNMPKPIIARFNENHLVDQLRNFIVAVQPSIAYRPFHLMTTYPRKVIEDEQQTFKEASLLNAGVTIKFDE